MTTLFTNLRVRGSDMYRCHCRGIRAPNRSLTIRLGQRGEKVPSYIQRRLADQYASADHMGRRDKHALIDKDVFASFLDMNHTATEERPDLETRKTSSASRLIA